MTVFVDTSALYALMDADDPNHDPASTYWRGALIGDESPVTHNYLVLETSAVGVTSTRAS